MEKKEELYFNHWISKRKMIINTDENNIETSRSYKFFIAQHNNKKLYQTIKMTFVGDNIYFYNKKVNGMWIYSTKEVSDNNYMFETNTIIDCTFLNKIIQKYTKILDEMNKDLETPEYIYRYTITSDEIFSFEEPNQEEEEISEVKEKGNDYINSKRKLLAQLPGQRPFYYIPNKTNENLDKMFLLKHLQQDAVINDKLISEQLTKKYEFSQEQSIDKTFTDIDVTFLQSQYNTFSLIKDDEISGLRVFICQKQNSSNLYEDIINNKLFDNSEVTNDQLEQIIIIMRGQFKLNTNTIYNKPNYLSFLLMERKVDNQICIYDLQTKSDYSTKAFNNDNYMSDLKTEDKIYNPLINNKNDSKFNLGRTICNLVILNKDIKLSKRGKYYIATYKDKDILTLKNFNEKTLYYDELTKLSFICIKENNKLYLKEIKF